MISCDECQKKLVAIFDNEADEADERLAWGHLKDCPGCRAFHKDMVRLRQQFVSVPVPGLLAAVGQELMQVAQADSLRSKSLRRDKGVNHQPLFVKFPRLRWACSLAGLFLIIISWLACFTLAKETASLRQELQAARQEIAVAQAEKQVKEAQERQQKAISALYFRMHELEKRIDRSPSPRSAFFPAELNGLSDRRSDL
jgi:hypothetical protein